jgi:hypothetical protein
MVLGEEAAVTERLDFTWVYPIVPLATFRMLTRLEHLDERARQLGHQGHTVLELREREGIFRTITERRVDAGLAAWGPRFFSGKNSVRQSQLWQAASWDGTRSYQMTVEIDGISISITGGGQLLPVNVGSTRYTLGLTLESSGRMAGRKLELGVATILRQTIEAEHTFRESWLERQAHHGF